MREMANKIEKNIQGSEKEQREEDVKMLRQILDNLLAFSVSQEYLMVQFGDLKKGSPSFNKYIKQQQDLKQQFKHVDDSLFAVSLRNHKIAEDITKEIGNVQYNLDKALSSLSGAETQKGLSHQQYTIAAANKLGDFLSETLNNMQMSLAGSSAGKVGLASGEGMQLQDIIKKQRGLGDKMKEGMPKGENLGKESGGQGGQGERNASDGMGEDAAEVLLGIYKEQKQLREALENELRRQGLVGIGESTLDKMKQIEKQLLSEGFNYETMHKIFSVNQELLKLNTAIQ
jgi:Mg2+ and Co2+ transporter CorA